MNVSIILSGHIHSRRDILQANPELGTIHTVNDKTLQTEKNSFLHSYKLSNVSVQGVCSRACYKYFDTFAKLEYTLAKTK